MPVWHASVSVLDEERQPVPTAGLTDKQRRRAQRLAVELLAGVGREPDRRTLHPLAHHLRRRLTPAELASIARSDPAWLSIPAVDAGGTGLGTW